MKTAADYIEALDLQPHPEGGWYRENYRSEEPISPAGLPVRFAGAVSMSTAIYFLLTADSFSALHRLKSDELWHFYAGSPLGVHIIEPSGKYRSLKLGAAIDKGESFQALVPAGCWFGARVEEKGGFALVGCTVAPGFDFANFELGDRAELVRCYPQHHQLIKALTRMGGSGAER